MPLIGAIRRRECGHGSVILGIVKHCCWPVIFTTKGGARQETPMITEDMTRAFNDPAASSWLKQTMIEAIKRDPVDCANDAEILAALLRGRADAMLRGKPGHGLYVITGSLTE